MRYQAFLEDVAGDGTGEVLQCNTIAEAWAFLDQRFDGTPGKRTWWLKDAEGDQYASAWAYSDIWEAQAETPQAFAALLDCIYGWDIPN